MWWHPDVSYQLACARLEDQRRAAARERLIRQVRQAQPRRLWQTLGALLTQSGRLLIRLGEGLVEPGGMPDMPADVAPHR